MSYPYDVILPEVFKTGNGCNKRKTHTDNFKMLKMERFFRRDNETLLIARVSIVSVLILRKRTISHVKLWSCLQFFRTFPNIYEDLRVIPCHPNAQNLASHQNESAQTWRNQVDPSGLLGAKYFARRVDIITNSMAISYLIKLLLVILMTSGIFKPARGQTGNGKPQNLL